MTASADGATATFTGNDVAATEPSAARTRTQ
jgi:hypothetical protein